MFGGGTLVQALQSAVTKACVLNKSKEKMNYIQAVWAMLTNHKAMKQWMKYIKIIYHQNIFHLANVDLWALWSTESQYSSKDSWPGPSEVAWVLAWLDGPWDLTCPARPKFLDQGLDLPGPARIGPTGPTWQHQYRYIIMWQRKNYKAFCHTDLRDGFAWFNVL